MASAKVGNLLVELEARTAKFDKDMKRAERLVKRTGSQARRTGKSVDTMAASFQKFGRIGLAALGVGGAASIANRLLDTAKAAEKLTIASDRLGVGVEALQEIRLAAESVQVPVEQTDLALQRFGRRVFEVAAGAGELKPTFDRLGISVRDSGGALKSQVDLLRELADAIQKTTSTQEALSIKQKAFDSEGVKFAAILDDGAEGFDRLAQASRDTGTVIERETIATLTEASEKLTLFNQKVEALATRTGGALAGLVVKTSAEQLEILDAKIQSISNALDNPRLGLSQVIALQTQLAEIEKERFDLFVKAAREGATAGTEARLRKEAEVEKIITEEKRKQKEIAEAAADLARREAEFASNRRGAEDLEFFLKRQQSISGSFEDLIGGDGAGDGYERFSEKILTGNELIKESGRDTFGSMGDALADFVQTGEFSFRGFFRSVSADITRLFSRQLILQTILSPLGLAPSAKGNVFSGGNLVPFAAGGVVNRPTIFPMANGGIGLMGEAGPEAIMPLDRGPDGKLGVRSRGGGGGIVVAPSISVEVRDPGDDGGAQRRGDIIGQETARQVEQMVRSVISSEKSAGGLLYSRAG